MQLAKETFLQLVRLGIGHMEPTPNRGQSDPFELPRCEGGIRSQTTEITEKVDWVALKALADMQGLPAIVLDGLGNLPHSSLAACQIPQKLRLGWIGEVLQMEARSDAQSKAAKSLGEFFQSNNIITYVLKGAVIAECYPNPRHRLSADLDCFLLPSKGDFDAWSLGDSLVKSQGYEVSEGFYKNSTFHLPGLMVENHRFMTPFRGNKKLRDFEILLQSLMRENTMAGVTDESRFDGTWLYRPPVMVSALFMIEHAYSHFLHEGLTWKMVLDWKMFCKRHWTEICREDFNALIGKFGFKKFYDSYARLGDYLVGEITAQELTDNDKLMLEDIWTPLDLHETLHGLKAKFQLAGNYWRARRKYRFFTDMTWLRALTEWVVGAVFERHPKLG